MKRIALAVMAVCNLMGCMKYEKMKKFSSSSSTPAQSEKVTVEMPTALRRITKSQYQSTIAQALGSEITPKTPLPDDPTKDELIAIATRDSVFSLRDAELYNNTGWDIAGQFTESTALFARRFDCACNDMNKACLSKGLDPIGRALFHGHFDDAAPYLQLFDDVSAQLAKEPSTTPTITTNCQSTRAVLAAMIGSPRTFYYEYPTDAASSQFNAEQKKEFSAGIASQLSFFLWNSPPDAKLLALAESGALADPKALGAQIRAMVDDTARFKSGMKALFDDWLSMQAVEKIASTTNTQADIAKGALAEYRFLVEKSIESPDFLNTFLTSNATLLDSNLATVYAVAATATTLPEASRAGFLTRSAFLVRAGAGATSPTKRGHYMRSRFFCEDIPPPPPNLDLTNGVPKTDDKYEIIKARMNNPNCKGCHIQMDPLGIGLEGYGPNGESVAFPNLAPYQLTASVADQAYSGGSELSQLLAKNDKVLTCFARHALRIGLGRKETAEDGAKLEQAVQAYQAGSNKSLNELVFHILSGTMQAGTGEK